MRNVIAIAGFAMLAACASPPVNRPPGEEFAVVSAVDLDRYLGAGTKSRGWKAASRKTARA